MKYYFPYFLITFLFSCSVNKDAARIDLYEKSIDDLQTMMSSGKLTSVQLTQYYVQRIEKLDKEIQSVIVINSDALVIAQKCDDDRKKRKTIGPMHGIPILIKDNIDTHDKMANTAGSIHLLNNFPANDAYIVEKIRLGGAVLLGKTNLSEWANFRSTKSISGWSSVGGQTKNPYNLLMTPCGSSAGTGAAIASDFATIGIGTETDGSIMCPSSVNGIVGLKPTVGLWSRGGIIPISKTQDTPGPMAKCVKDAAILLGVAIGYDKKDETTNHNFFEEDYAKYCVKGNLQGKRIGVDTSFLNGSYSFAELFREAIDLMKLQGAIIIETNHRSLLASTRAREYDLMLYEFKDGLNEYLDKNVKEVSSLENLIALNEKYKDRAMPLFGQEIFEAAQAKTNLEDADYLSAIASSTMRCRFVIDSVMMANKLDAFVGPTLGPAWPIDPKSGKGFSGPSSYGIAAISGYPSITVPLGFVDKLPVGICFIGAKFQEGKIIGAAYDYEQISKKRIPPKL